MTKAEIRETVWNRIENAGVGRFPGTRGRIPNFDGAGATLERLRELAVWRRALVVKVNPDAPQLAIRRAALAAGKIIYMAVPRLRSEKCFIELDPRRLPAAGVVATSIRGACRYGRLVTAREIRPIDLVVCGSVAVTRDGARIGQGGGYADLEYAVLRDEGKLRESTPIVTTVHPLQLVRHHLPMLPHDVPVDFLVTPSSIVATRSAHARPRGIYWDLLRPLRVNAIPMLRKRLQRGRAGTRSPGTL